MIKPEQASKLSGVRKVLSLSRRFVEGEQENLALRYAQVGLPFVSEHSAFLTVHLKPKGTLLFADFKKIVRDLQDKAQKDNFKWLVVVSVSFERWIEWSKGNSFPIQKGLFNGQEELLRILAENHPPYAYDGGDMFFQIQSYEQEQAKMIVRNIIDALHELIDLEKTNFTLGDSIHYGRIYGGRMLHGLISSVDPICFSARALIGDEFQNHKGGCFCLTQRFVHDWQQLQGMADNELENLIGRNHHGNMITNDDDRAHVRLARVNDEDGINYRLVGQSQPFRSESSMPGKEDGVYQISYAKRLEAFIKVLQSMLGNKQGYIKCRHLSVSTANLGSFWYTPSAPELGLPSPHDTLTISMNEFFDVRSKNGKMFYNSKDYLYQVGNKHVEFVPAVTDRVIELLGYTFSRWHDTWYKRRPAPELGHLKEYLESNEQELLNTSITIRKGVSTKKVLKLLSEEKHGKQFDTFRLHPKELIVGSVPDYTLGSGFEVIKYFTQDEADEAYLVALSEGGAAGHNVPFYERILQTGVGGLLDEVKTLMAKSVDTEAKEFFESVVLSLEGVQVYFRNYAGLAQKKLLDRSRYSKEDSQNLEAIASRMLRLSTEPPKSFIDAAQLIFSMHCCMHISGEGVSIGRLDQLLYPFFQKDSISMNEAQEIIDCFWIKMDEKVLLNHHHFNDRLERGSVAITYAGGDFPQGAALNQWVQQITVGGYKANDAEIPEDACNDVTRMCLRAARRLPLNAPCLSIRIHENTPEDIFMEITETILSGGAHPFLINDNKTVAGLMRSGEGILHSGTLVRTSDARNMVCDGCFESLVGGKSEFAFSFVSVPDAIEMTLNRGNTYSAAGPVHIRGLKASFRSKPANEIENWDEFYQIFLKHYRYKLISFYTGMLSRYGNLHKFCPSPLLSSLIDGCLESGRDISAGGARYKILSPLMNGMPCAIDSLWAIRDMVFSNSAVFSLPELLDGLICDWGFDMKEPFYSKSIGEDRILVSAERYKELRLYALSLPKFGQGIDEIDTFGKQVVLDLVNMSVDILRNPVPQIKNLMNAIRTKYSTPKNQFEFLITPGVATFEDYAGIGSFLGASADGRRNCHTVSSDFSPACWPLDLPVPRYGRPAIESLKSWKAINPGGTNISDDPIGVGISNGAPIDINIYEDFPNEQLNDLIKRFSTGDIGSNMMSVTCANADTLLEAQNSPERYDLVRMRMGGWSEFFVAMFPHHQEQHKRRPVFEAKTKLTHKQPIKS
jgi:pyruvate-formate lyase/deferrochelatase/peroxidase EfeB